MTSLDLSGKRALVTGGARGFGAAIAQSLAEAGAAVMIGDILDDLGRETADLIGKTGPAAHTRLDITDEVSWESAVAATVDRLGGFDILVNNAGVEVTALLVDLDPAELTRMLQVN